MKFAFLIYPEDGTDIDAKFRSAMNDWFDHLQNLGVFILQQPFYPPGAANTVSLVDGIPTMAPNPVSDEAFVVSGIEFVDVADMKAAVELAKRHPAVTFDIGKIEIRQAWNLFDTDL